MYADQDNEIRWKKQLMKQSVVVVIQEAYNEKHGITRKRFKKEYVMLFVRQQAAEEQEIYEQGNEQLRS